MDEEIGELFGVSLVDRLDSVSIQLEEHGLTHIKNRSMMMRRYKNRIE